MCMMLGRQGSGGTISCMGRYLFFAYNYPHTLESGSCGAFAELVYRRRCHTGKNNPNLCSSLSVPIFCHNKHLFHWKRFLSGIHQLQNPGQVRVTSRSSWV
jgi:hypothetical protein